MQGALIILGSWLAFGGSHLLLSSSGARARIVQRFGAEGFTIAFAFVSLLTMTPLIMATVSFGGEGALMPAWLQQDVVRLAAGLIAGLGALLAIAGLVNFGHSPISKLAQRLRSDGDWTSKPPTRIDSITRHPFFVGIGALAIAHLLLVSTLASAAFFVGLAALSLLGIPLQDRKLRNQWPAEYGPYEDSTSAMPFASPYKPQPKPTGSWVPWLIALVITAILAGLMHPLLSWGNGAGFALGILAFGLLATAGGIVESRMKSSSTADGPKPP